jgi:hypothetical protein
LGEAGERRAGRRAGCMMVARNKENLIADIRKFAPN